MNLSQHWFQLFKSATAQRISRNSIWLLLGRLGSQGLLFLFSVLTARALGEAGLGQYAFIAAILFVGNMITTFGMDTLLIRDIARQNQAASASTAAALVIQLTLSLLFILIAYLGADFLPHQAPTTIAALHVYSLALLPMAFLTIFTAVLRAHERMALFLVVTMITAVIQTGGAFLLFQFQGGLLQLAWLLLLVQIVGAVSGGWLCYHEFPTFSFHWTSLNSHNLYEAVRIGLPLALLTTCTVLYRRMGIFALSTLTNDASTGWFSAAMRLVEVGRMLPYALFGALFPVLARQKLDIPTTSHRRLIALAGLLMVMTGTAAGLWLLAAPLITWLFGENYAPAIPALRILAWSLPPFTTAMALSMQLIAQDQERLVLGVTGLTVVGTAVALRNAIPIWGVTGAAWTLVLSETVQTLLLGISAARKANA